MILTKAAREFLEKHFPSEIVKIVAEYLERNDVEKLTMIISANRQEILADGFLIYKLDLASLFRFPYESMDANEILSDILK